MYIIYADGQDSRLSYLSSWWYFGGILCVLFKRLNECRVYLHQVSVIKQYKMK